MRSEKERGGDFVEEVVACLNSFFAYFKKWGEVFVYDFFF